MKKPFYFISIIINLFGMVQAVYALDFIFATAFMAAIFMVIIMMIDGNNDQNRPDPPKVNQVLNKLEKAPNKTGISKTHELPKGGS